jgi:phage terminase large subunit-like protein
MGRRFYLNQIRQETDSWIRASDWQAVEREEEVPEGAFIVLGFDGSRFRDATALVGTVIETGYQWVLGVWERPELAVDWEVPVDEVNAVVAEAFGRYDVWRMYCDPYWWEETVSKWAGMYGAERVAFYHTNTRISTIARAIKAYETAVKTHELAHEADERFAEHVSHVVKRITGIKDEDREPMYLIAKENPSSPRKIDIAMAAVLSWEARTHAIAEGATPNQHITPGVFWFEG